MHAELCMLLVIGCSRQSPTVGEGNYQGKQGIDRTFWQCPLMDKHFLSLESFCFKLFLVFANVQ